MVQLGIRSVVIKKYRHYSSNKPVDEKENILKQDFTTAGINQKWCTDITYIHTQEDVWTYPASVMNFYSRKIIGWSYGTTMSAEIVTKAVENACSIIPSAEKAVLTITLALNHLILSLRRKKLLQDLRRFNGCLS